MNLQNTQFVSTRRRLLKDAGLGAAAILTAGAWQANAAPETTPPVGVSPSGDGYIGRLDDEQFA